VKGVVLFHGDALAFSSFSASDTRRMTRVIRRALLAEGGGDAEARAKATRAEAARGVEACGGGGGGGGGASWPFMDGEWRAVASSSSPPPPLPMHLADGVVDAFAVLPPSGDAVAVVALARGGAADANEGENETARLRDAVAAAASPRLVDLHAALSYSPTAETTTRGGADADADADADATCEPRERHVYAFRDPASATRVGSSRERRVEGTSASALRTLVGCTRRKRRRRRKTPRRRRRRGGCLSFWIKRSPERRYSKPPRRRRSSPRARRSAAPFAVVTASASFVRRYCTYHP
jgi:hypothetical protein